jgi:hypothetical protein
MNAGVSGGVIRKICGKSSLDPGRQPVLVALGATALNSLAVPLCALRQLVGTLVDLFAFLRHQVSAPALLPVPSCLQRREVDPPIEVQAAAPSGQPD